MAAAAFGLVGRIGRQPRLVRRCRQGGEAEQRRCEQVPHGRAFMRNASTSPFSALVQARPRTSLQLRLNHFSVFAASAKRSAFAMGDSGAMALPVFACLPCAVPEAPWQLAQLHSAPWRALKNCSPRYAETPENAGFSRRAAAS